MKRRSLVALLVLGAVSSVVLGATARPAPALSRQRLSRVYVLLTDARETARGKILPPEADLIRMADGMPFETLKKECVNNVDAFLLSFTSVSRDNRGEAFGYVKNAKLRLIFDREEPQGGHIEWTRQVGPTKTSVAARELAQEIKKALGNL